MPQMNSEAESDTKLTMTTSQAPSSCESEKLCDSCQHKDNNGREIPGATQYCPDCNENHCPKCSKYHAKLIATRHHKNINNLKSHRNVLDAETLRLHMEHQRSKLIELIDSEFGLLDHLISEQVIPRIEIEQIRAEKTRCKKNERLLDYIFSNNKHKNLMMALPQYSQSHVANWIIANGDHRQEFGLDWPLLDECNTLDKNQSSLVETIDPFELVDRLYSEEAISKCHRYFISAKTTDYDKNVALLDIISRSSIKTYRKLQKCLRESNQYHISKILETDGVVVPVHATLESDDIVKAETQIVNEMTEFLRRNTTSMEQANRLIAGLQLNILAVKRGESIVLYIGCYRNEELNHLCKVVDNMGTKGTLERLFVLCAGKQTIKVCEVKVYREDLAKALNTFAEKQKNKSIRGRVVEMYKEFVSEVDPKNVFDLLIQKRVISIEQKQKISNKATVIDRCRALLEHLLFCSHDKAFIVLREALKDQYRKIVQCIDQCEAENETANIQDAKYHQSMMTKAGQQEHPEDPAHMNLSSDVKGTRQKNVQSLIRMFEPGNKNLGQKREESRKETAEMKEQNRIQKEGLNKELDREKNLKKELDAIKTRTEPEIQDKGILGNVRVPYTTLDRNEPHQNPSAFSSGSSKSFKSCVFVIGIDDGSSATKDVIKIDLNQTEEVSNIQQMPVEEVWESAAAVYCNSLFVTGIGTNRDEIWRFNATSSSSKWKKCASLVQGRQCHSVAFVDHVLYICGGWVESKKKTLDDVDAIDTHKDQCATVGKLNFAVRNSGNCVQFKSVLYIFGGLDRYGKVLYNVQVYNTNSNTCTVLSKNIPMAPRHDCHLPAVVWENTVILFGSDFCLTYNIETEVWKVRDQFETGAACFGLTISNGLVFVIGGGRLINDSDGNEKWTCRDDVRCVPVVNILNDEPIEWKHHAKLPKPSLVFAFGKMDF